MPDTLKILPYYTGAKTLDEIRNDRKSLDLLWLEILLNDEVDWEGLLKDGNISTAHRKASLWYSNFSALIDGLVGRKPLRHRKGKVDMREYRKFIEAIRFVAPRH